LKNGRSIPDKKSRGSVFLEILGSRLGRGEQIVEDDKDIHPRKHEELKNVKNH